MGECCTHCSECDRKKVRDEKEYKDLMNRLSRIEGQVRGIKGMLEKDAYCPEILVQVSAVNGGERPLLRRYPDPGIRDPVCIKQLQQGTAFQPHQILRCGGYPAGKRRRRG